MTTSIASSHLHIAKALWRQKEEPDGVAQQYSHDLYFHFCEFYFFMQCRVSSSAVAMCMVMNSVRGNKLNLPSAVVWAS